LSRQFAVLVYGATGFSGRLVLPELLRLKLPFAIAGRPSRGLEALAAEHRLEHFAVELDEPRALADAFSRATVVLACAGPYAQTGPALLGAALTAGTHLLDLSGEPQHLRASLGRADEVAGRIAVVHSVGFDVVPGELLAHLCQKPLGPLELLELATAHTPGIPSHGTLQSYLGMARAQPGQGLSLVNGVLVDEPLGAHRRSVHFPLPLGERAAVSVASAEVVLLARSLPTQNLHHYQGTLAPAALAVAEKGLPTFTPSSLEKSLAHLAANGQSGPDPVARANSRFALWCRAQTASGSVRAMTMEGADPYGVTAVLAAACAQWASQSGFQRRGVLSPLQAFEAQPLLATLAHAGARWRPLSER
jgi:short subunit dehydrogenase-like uncharacterized protein